MATNQTSGRDLAIASHSEARGRCRIRQAFTKVADTLQGGRPHPRWMFDDAVRPDAEARGNVGFITADVRHLRRVLAAAKQEGPLTLQEARTAVRAYFAEKLSETLNGYEVVSLDLTCLGDETAVVIRESTEFVAAAAEYREHPTAGMWARVQKEWHDLLDRSRLFLTLGRATSEAPHHRPAA